jgi:deoxyguanosine kinase
MTERDEKEKLSQRYPFIAVVGPVGIGKTTFTELLINGTGITQFQEPYKENPYLYNFYTKDPADFSFDSQMFFLANNGVQIKNISKLSKVGPVLEDAGREMNFIIATVQQKMGWMTDTEYGAYVATHNSVYSDALKPDIYIALKANENTVIERIIGRDREMELIMMKNYPEYFPTLVWEFDNWLEKKRRDCESCVAVIDTDKFDYAKNHDGKEAVVTEAKNWLRYYISHPHQRNGTGTDGAKLIMPSSFRTALHFIDRVPGAKRIY